MNNLSNEKSEYLLQHSNNPVNWFPWGKEAFDKADDRELFYKTKKSIGNYANWNWPSITLVINNDSGNQ